MNTELCYRISSWIPMPSQFKGLRFRKAMVAMSVDHAPRLWLERHCGLTRRELHDLLSALADADVLEIAQRDTGPLLKDASAPTSAFAEASVCRQPNFLQWIIGRVFRSTERPAHAKSCVLPIDGAGEDLGWHTTVRRDSRAYPG